MVPPRIALQYILFGSGPGVASLMHEVVSGREPVQCTSLHYANCPVIAGKPLIGHIGIGQREVTLHTPSIAPRIPHDKPLLAVIIAYCENCMPPNNLLTRRRQRSMTALSHRLTFETLVDGHTKDVWETGGKAAFHLVEVTDQSLVENCSVLKSILIAGIWGLIFKLRNIVWPFCFRENSMGSHAFDTISNLRAAIRVDGTLHRTFIVVNEQAGGGKKGQQILFHPVKLDGAGYCVCCTISQFT